MQNCTLFYRIARRRVEQSSLIHNRHATDRPEPIGKHDDHAPGRPIRGRRRNQSLKAAGARRLAQDLRSRAAPRSLSLPPVVTDHIVIGKAQPLPNPPFRQVEHRVQMKAYRAERLRQQMRDGKPESVAARRNSNNAVSGDPARYVALIPGGFQRPPPLPEPTPLSRSRTLAYLGRVTR